MDAPRTNLQKVFGQYDLLTYLLTYNLASLSGSNKFGPFLDLCVSSLRRGHANLLCIVPILSNVSEETVVGQNKHSIGYYFALNA